MIRRTAALLALLLTLPLTGIFADNGGAGVRSYNLTERYGVDDVRHVFFFSRERLCALSVREKETVDQYDLVFIDLEQAEPLGAYLDGGEDVLHMLAPDQYETRVLPITDVTLDPEFLEYDWYRFTITIGESRYWDYYSGYDDMFDWYEQLLDPSAKAEDRRSSS